MCLLRPIYILFYLMPTTYANSLTSCNVFTCLKCWHRDNKLHLVGLGEVCINVSSEGWSMDFMTRSLLAVMIFFFDCMQLISYLTVSKRFNYLDFHCLPALLVVALPD